MLKERSHDGTLCLYPAEGEWEELTQIVASENKVGLFFEDQDGWRGDTFPALEKAESVVRLGFGIPRVRDEGLLASLPNLESLGMGVEHFEGDLSSAPKLKRINADWCRGLESLFACRQLRTLILGGYPGPTLKDFASLESLGSLELNFGKISSTEGLDSLPNLWGLEIACQKRLTSGGVRLPASIQALDFNTCKALGDINFVEQVPDLRWMIMVNCGKIQSLHPIRFCPRINHLGLCEGTIVEDNDVRFLLEEFQIECIAFDDRRSYNARRAEFPDIRYAKGGVSWHRLTDSPFPP